MLSRREAAQAKKLQIEEEIAMILSPEARAKLRIDVLVRDGGLTKVMVRGTLNERPDGERVVLESPS